MGVELERSAGGVVVDERGRVLLIKTRDLKGRPVWTLPKGLIQPGESPQEAARREVREETGYECEVVGELPPSRYWFRREGRLVRKTVHWFQMRPLRKVGAPDWEVEAVAWVPLEEAPQRLSYKGDRELLERLDPARGARANARKEG